MVIQRICLNITIINLTIVYLVLHVHDVVQQEYPCVSTALILFAHMIFSSLLHVMAALKHSVKLTGGIIQQGLG